MIVYGRNSIEEALVESLELREVWIDSSKANKYPGLRRLLKEKNIITTFASSKELDKISGVQKHQGIVGDMLLPDNIITEDKNYTSHYAKLSRILLLDGITDTGNLGSILRSAVLLGAELVLLPKDNSARITPQTIKASAGAIYKINLAYIDNLKSEIEQLKSEKFEVLALTGESIDSIYDFKVNTNKIALVLGSEREGIRKGIKSLCTKKLSLPSTRKIDSFNVSVAAALAMNSLWKEMLKL